MSAEKGICTVSSMQDFVSLRDAVISAHVSLVIHFKAEWCEPCKQVTSFLETQSAIYSSCVKFAEVDAEQCEEVFAHEQITSVPFISFYRFSKANNDLERVADVPGAKIELIRANLVSLFGDVSNGTCCARQQFTSLNEYLQHLTSRHGIVIFITGTPSRPQCGFTRRLCDMLHEMNAPYIYYDIMGDNEVCEGLKTFSDWPTFPQVYVDGELIGGYDICKELNDRNELRKVLKLST